MRSCWLGHEFRVPTPLRRPCQYSNNFNTWKSKNKIVGTKEATTYELTLPVAVKGSKISCSSGEDSSAVGSDGLDAPKSSSSGFLFLLRLSGEAAGGGEFE
jgi:hypothetical protein